jgi:hypothetical protein
MRAADMSHWGDYGIEPDYRDIDDRADALDPAADFDAADEAMLARIKRADGERGE